MRLSTPLFLAAAVAALAQQPLRLYVSDEFTFAYPADWRIAKHGSGVALTSPDAINPISIQLAPSGLQSRDEFFREYLELTRKGWLGFPAVFATSTQPVLYGQWRGDALVGFGRIRGLNLAVEATAIEANGQYYLLQTAAPLARNWEALEHRAAIGRTLTFRNLSSLPPPSPSGYTGCAHCFEAITSGMDRLTQMTVRGMR